MKFDFDPDQVFILCKALFDYQDRIVNYCQEFRDGGEEYVTEIALLREEIAEQLKFELRID